ncbi:S8 family serine peptidase [bacterium]|nr:S8 family serine peptidase [bacterium]
MNRYMWSVVLFGALLCGAYGAQAADVVTPRLAERMAQAGSDQLIRVNIIMQRQADVAQLRAATKGLSKAQKRQLVIDRLSELATESQSGLLSLLEKAQAQGKVERLGSLWLGNTVCCSATKQIIDQVAAMSGIRSIDWDEFRQMLHKTMDKTQQPLSSLRSVKKTKSSAIQKASIKIPDAAGQGDQSSGKEIVWGVSKINADDVWALGYTGDGIIVGALDTGVNYNHLDLQDHMWDGSAFGLYNHGYDFINGDVDPMDDDSVSPGHGTHTAGTIAGDGTAGSQVGVAPDAIIMAMKIMDGAGSGTESGVWYAMEYSVTWGADVLSMSAGWVHEWDPDLCAWRAKCDVLLALGIVFCTSAGNGRPYPPWGHFNIPDDISTPADVPAPWYPSPDPGDEHHSSILAIGATSSSDYIASFSSYGPTEWDESCTGHDYDDYPYDPGDGLMKPDLCAPGVSIKSLAHDNNSGYRGPYGWSGTSMSCPHVAGTIALMLEKNPYLTPVEIDSILETTAIDRGPHGRDNEYGAGRIDALAAVEATPAGGAPPEAPDNVVAQVVARHYNHLDLVWSSVTKDTSGGSIIVEYYVVYRGTDPEGTMDSLNATSDTTYTDTTAAVGNVSINHYYVLKAVDTGGQKSSESNMVGEFDIFLITGE